MEVLRILSVSMEVLQTLPSHLRYYASYLQVLQGFDLSDWRAPLDTCRKSLKGCITISDFCKRKFRRMCPLVRCVNGSITDARVSCQSSSLLCFQFASARLFYLSDWTAPLDSCRRRLKERITISGFCKRISQSQYSSGASCRLCATLSPRPTSLRDKKRGGGGSILPAAH